MLTNIFHIHTFSCELKINQMKECIKEFEICHVINGCDSTDKDKEKQKKKKCANLLKKNLKIEQFDTVFHSLV